MNILDLYKELAENKRRFIDEVFEAEIYRKASPSLNILDLGAFEGEYCFSCLPFANNLWAIEPDPVPFKRMVEMVEKYNLTNIKCYPIAISGKSGKRDFHASHGGGSALGGTGNTDGSAMEVDTLTLNGFLIREHIEHIDIMKIDVESSEGEIFRAPDFKEAATKIDKIIGEPHAGEEVLPLLRNVGYTASISNGTFYAYR